MKPWMKFILMLISALTPIVIAGLTFLQGQANKADAVRTHDRLRRDRHSHATVESWRSRRAEGRKTNMEAIAESVRVAYEARVDDTATVIVQPTTVGRMLGQKEYRARVRSLRNQVGK